MERLNYQHLYYFWTVAKAGSIKSACDLLGLAQPTISGQLALFEKAIGTKLFKRESRKLILTEGGWQIFSYADEIFSIGGELSNWLKGKSLEQRRTLKVAVCNRIDVLIVRDLLAPAFEVAEPPHLTAIVGDAENLLQELRLRTYDLAMLTEPLPSANGGSPFSHPIANLEISLFGPPDIAKKLRESFPRSIDGVPMVLPAAGSRLRKSLDRWMEVRGIQPDIRAEISASELAKSVALACGAAIFAPTVTQKEMLQRYRLEAIGVAEGVEERVYAITNQRKIRSPAAARIVGIKSA